MGAEAGGGARISSGLDEAGGLKHRDRSTHNEVGDAGKLKDTSGGRAKELAVRGGGRGRLGGHSGDTGNAGDAGDSELDGTSRNTRD
ncbi:hypothetical protein ROHU_015310 [Labeo rohita]|uniref:Uncharacterized protein n=1 Tax=Labeo rohita TaxID=84645 RepID=A0A498NPX1_LABRO|nr:hypothetical protein ROHU_035078 [Labeo rohita]RXN33871.1 hypothetical protein ROHU_015310 [Labeo rohita]